jgi:tetraacyldisaccharide 4'-kinase
VTERLPVRSWVVPLVPLYRLALALREAGLRSGLQPVRRLRWPVVSIGNLSTGGAGKTPMTIALAQALTRRSLSVDVLSRGYGRLSREAARVDANGTAEEFGDEPIEIARAAGVPVYVAAQRYEAGILAERDAEESFRVKGTGFSPYIDDAKLTGALAPEGSLPGIHLLDDGFQHRQLHRDIDILLLNSNDLKDRLLPAGNLREPLRALQRASCIAIPAEDRAMEEELKTRGWQGEIWRIHRRMDVPRIEGPVVAFCGIARPEQFFHGLENAGLQLAARVAFTDHHRYTASDVERLQASARGSNAAALITTEKDRVRMGKLAYTLPASLLLSTAALRVEIENEGAVIDYLLSI